MCFILSSRSQKSRVQCIVRLNKCKHQAKLSWIILFVFQSINWKIRRFFFFLHLLVFLNYDDLSKNNNRITQVIENIWWIPICFYGMNAKNFLHVDWLIMLGGVCQIFLFVKSIISLRRSRCLLFFDVLLEKNKIK